MSTIGMKLKKQREKLGYTLEKVANEVGVTRSTVLKYENGVINIPSDKIEKLSQALRITPSYLMGWEDEEKNDERLKDLSFDEIAELEKILNETNLFFNNEEVSNESKKKLRSALMEIFFDALAETKK